MYILIFTIVFILIKHNTIIQNIKFENLRMRVNIVVAIELIG